MARRAPKRNNKKLSTKQFVGALARTLKMAYRAAPSAVYIRIVDIIIGAIIPVVLVVLAAATTTQLVETFNGKPGAQDTVIVLIIITAFVGLVQIAWNNISTYIDRLIRYRVELGVSTEMFERFIKLDFWRYDDKETIDTYEKASRFTNFFSYTFATLGRIISDIVAIITSIVALGFIAPWMSLMMLAAVIPGVIVQIRIARSQAMHWNNNMKNRREANYIEYNLIQPDAIAELRIYKLAQYMLERRKKLIEADEKGNLLIERRYINWQIATNALLSIAEIIALIWIVLLIAAKQQTVGQFIYVQQMVSRALGAASGVASSLGRLDEDLANLTDYDAFMQLPLQSDKSEKVGPLRTIEVKNVSFQYPKSSRTSLKDVTMTIPVGKHIAIVGENGAGKSTFIKLLLGLYSPTEGDVLVNGKKLETYDIQSWHDQLGVLLQDFVRYHTATIRENIFYGDINKKRSDALVSKAVEDAVATEFIDALPKKLETRSSSWFTNEDEEAAMVSGGQWQRIALARNFYREAPIIILDEPTSAIDALAETKIFKRLLSKDNEQTIITISHRLTTVEKADIIYVFKDGYIAEQGSHKELVAQSGEYARMFEDQLHRDDS